MPTIEITDAQARALAAGKSITLNRPAKVLACHKTNGAVCLLTDPERKEGGAHPFYRGHFSWVETGSEWTTAKIGPSGTTGLFYDYDWTFVPVPSV